MACNEIRLSVIEIQLRRISAQKAVVSHGFFIFNENFQAENDKNEEGKTICFELYVDSM